MSERRPDGADRERALRVRAAIARGATITQHGGGVIAMSVEGEGGALVLTGDEMRRIITGWPRPDEAEIPRA